MGPGASCIFDSQVTSNLAIEMQGRNLCTDEHVGSISAHRSWLYSTEQVGVFMMNKSVMYFKAMV